MDFSTKFANLEQRAAEGLATIKTAAAESRTQPFSRRAPRDAWWVAYDTRRNTHPVHLAVGWSANAGRSSGAGPENRNPARCPDRVSECAHGGNPSVKDSRLLERPRSRERKEPPPGQCRGRFSLQLGVVKVSGRCKSAGLDRNFVAAGPTQPQSRTFRSCLRWFRW